MKGSEGFVRARLLSILVAALAAAAPVAATPAAASPAVTPGPTVYPGMEIRQGSTMCTLGYVDMASRSALTAGHCRGDGPVTDRDGNVIGAVTLSRDNTPDGATITADYQITDWEAIALAPDVQMVDVLPGGRALVSDPNLAVQKPGQPVCHFGIITGETCGTINAVNNGWFTMTNGVVSQKGDSGGPVYVPTADGRAVIIGLFNSTWGQLPAAVSFESTGQQIIEATAIQPTNSNTGIETVFTRSSASVASGVKPPM